VSGELQVGLVGCGRLAERGYLPAIERAKGIRLVGIADPVSSRCRRLAAEVPTHDSAAALLAGGNLEALVLATPAAAHLADARLAAAD
jgi:predicted dehydrogenase